MPFKVDAMHRIPVHKRAEKKLFKSNDMNNSLIKDCAKNISNNVHMHFATNIVFKLIDKMSPFINKYPKIGKLIIDSGEIIIKLSGDFNKHIL